MFLNYRYYLAIKAFLNTSYLFTADVFNDYVIINRSLILIIIYFKIKYRPYNIIASETLNTKMNKTTLNRRVAFADYFTK